MGTVSALIGIWMTFSLVEAHSKAVTTSLTTKWFSTPLLLEASEFLAEEDNEKFWNFVETCQNFQSSNHDGSDYSSYNAVLQAASENLSSLQRNLLKFALSLRSYSATVQAFQQVPKERKSLQHRTFLSPPDISTTERPFGFGPVASFFLALLVVAICSSQ